MEPSSSQPTVVFGCTGQVGHHLCNLYGSQAVGLPSEKADFTKPDLITEILEQIQPSAVINAAAYTAVDQAESDQNLAQQINATTPGLIANFCADHGIPMIQYSTDYVFSGDKQGAYTEDDPVKPVNFYGASKLDGERRIASAGGNHLIFRTSWVYSEYGHNFVKTMLKLGAERESLKIVADQTGSPTSAIDIAVATRRALDVATTSAHFPSGIYNMTGSGECSWYDFAKKIFAEARDIGYPLVMENLVPISTEDFPTAARRPANSVLNNDKLNARFNIQLPPWEKSLRQTLERIYEN